jgi:hypothetical protein
MWFPITVTCIICHGVSNSVRCARRKNPPRVPAAGFLPIACKPPACPCPSTESPIRARFPKLFRSDLCLAWRAHFFLWYCSQAKRDSCNYRLNGEWDEIGNLLYLNIRCYIKKTMQWIYSLCKNNSKLMWNLQSNLTFTDVEIEILSSVCSSIPTRDSFTLKLKLIFFNSEKGMSLICIIYCSRYPSSMHTVHEISLSCSKILKLFTEVSIIWTWTV